MHTYYVIILTILNVSLFQTQLTKNINLIKPSSPFIKN